MPLLSNAQSPKSAYTLEVNASIVIADMFFCSRHIYEASLGLRPQQSTMLQLTHSPHPRLMRQKIGVDLLTQISFMSMKKKVHVPSSEICESMSWWTNESMTWWVQNSRTPERLSKTQSSKPLRNRSISKLHSFALSLASLRMVWACKYSKALLPTLKSGHLRSKA